MGFGNAACSFIPVSYQIRAAMTDQNKNTGDVGLCDSYSLALQGLRS